MNEVLGPLYYVFASASDGAWSIHAEADAFFCFSMLMADFRDNFIKTLDYSELGIGIAIHRSIYQSIYASICLPR